MNKEDLLLRTKNFALEIIKLVSKLPKNQIVNVIGYQILKSGTSIGANYREALKAESTGDFIHKIGIVTKEANETHYWLELLIESGTIKEEEYSGLVYECNELIAIFTSTGKSAKKRL